MVTVTKPPVTIRLAQRDEGPTLHRLALASGKWEIAGLDWTFDPSGYWFIAEYEGHVVGCIQAVPGVPFGHIEFLCVLPSLSHSLQALTARDLCEAGRAACRLAGAQFVSFALHPGLEGWARVLGHRGAIEWFKNGTNMVMRA